MYYDTDERNTDFTQCEYSVGHFLYGINYFQLRGEFCVSRHQGFAHGYTTKGVFINDYCGKNKHTFNDFMLFVKEISDNGTAIFNRPFTSSERSFLVLKFGFPMIPENDVTLFYNKLNKFYKMDNQC